MNKTKSSGEETQFSWAKKSVASLEREEWAKITKSVSHLQAEYVAGGYSEEKERRQ